MALNLGYPAVRFQQNLNLAFFMPRWLPMARSERVGFCGWNVDETLGADSDIVTCKLDEINLRNLKIYIHIYIYLEPVWGLNPPKEGLFQSKQGSFGFQVYIYIHKKCVHTCMHRCILILNMSLC